MPSARGIAAGAGIGAGAADILGAAAGYGSSAEWLQDPMTRIYDYFNPQRGPTYSDIIRQQTGGEDPRIAGWRPAPDVSRETSNEFPAVERARLTADAQSDPLGGPRGDTFAQRFEAGGPSVADAYRMAGLADMANYYEPTPREERLAWENAARLADAYQRQKEPQLQLVRGQSLAGFKPPTAQQIASELGTMETVRDLTVPQTPLDYASMALLPARGISTAAKVAGLVGGGLLESDPAEAAGKGKTIGALLRAVEKPAVRTVENWPGLGGRVGGPWEGGIATYHSSPHDFERFDLSKLRSGEGANTYGAGFYSAENPAVSGRGGQYWGQFLHRFDRTPELEAAQILRNNNFDRSAAINEVQGLVQHYDDKHSRDMLKLLESDKPIGTRTYELNLKVKPEELLDWDKPLRDQPIAEKVARLVPSDLRQPFESNVASGVSGGNVYHNYVPGQRFAIRQRGAAQDEYIASTAKTFDEALARVQGDPSRVRRINDPALVSNTLNEAGIPGIRYLDQGSRPDQVLLNEIKFYQTVPETAFSKRKLAELQARLAEQPPQTYNYVMFDPSKIDIMAKYGVVGGAPIMSGLAAQDRYD